MSEFKPANTSPADQSASEPSIEVLHERVNQMLEMPLPKEGDAWPLPVEDTIEPHPPAPAH